jgi:hypothetical protein
VKKLKEKCLLDALGPQQNKYLGARFQAKMFLSFAQHTKTTLKFNKCGRSVFLVNKKEGLTSRIIVCTMRGVVGCSLMSFNDAALLTSSSNVGMADL